MRASEIAERALLGAILLDHARLADVQQWLEPADFYAYRHGLVYTEMLELRRTGQEPTARSVLDRVIPSAESRRQVDGPYLHTLMESCPHPSRAPIYGRMVLEASIHRRSADRATRLGYVAQSECPADVVIDQLGREVDDWKAELQLLEQRWAQAGEVPTESAELDIPDSGTQARAVVADAAEISLIASLMASPWQYEHIKDWLRPEDFSRHDMRVLYTAIVDVAEHGQPVDGVTVMWAALRTNGSTDHLNHEAVARLSQAGVPGYAAVAAREVLEASLRSHTTSTARQLESVARTAQMRPPKVMQSVRRELDGVTFSCQRWSASLA